MSLLSDLLSKIKHPEPRKDIPPGLRSTVFAIKKEEFNKRRFIIIAVFAFVALGSGFGIVYILNNYLNAPVRHAVPSAEKIRQPEAKREVASDETGVRKPEQSGTVPQKTAEDARQGIGQTPQGKTEPDIPVKPIPSQRPQGPSEKRTSEPAAAKPKEPAADTKKEIRAKKEALVQAQQSAVPQAPKSQDSGTQNAGVKEMHLYMGEGYEKKKDFSNAIASYKKVLDIEPGNFRVINKLAHIFIQMNLHDEALKHLQSALKLKPDYVPALINSGIAYAKSGNPAEAESALLNAIAIEGTNQPALLNIAILYEKQGRYDLAKSYYLRLQRLGNMQGSAGIERIDALKAVTSNK
jgi:tetratricopeptide (TPR) repeat protein